jgi:C4-dicarboxylate-specific signal transduction histidine kinase
MSGNNKPHVQESELAFFSAITTSATHEMNNVLAITEQTAGLLEDLCIEDVSEINLSREKLKGIVDRITRQLARGSQIMQRLNSFAHGADNPTQTAELNALLENLVMLMQRFAAMKKIRLDMVPASQLVPVCGRIFTLESEIFNAINAAIEESPSGATINITVRNEKIQIVSELRERGLDITLLQVSREAP